MDGRPWVERRHGPLHPHVCSFLPFYPITKVSPIREPRGVALWRQIIRDDFILITFCLIFFYRHGATLHWLGSVPQVGGGVRGTQIGVCLFFAQLEGKHDFSSWLTRPESRYCGNLCHFNELNFPSSMKITVQLPVCLTEGARFKSRQEIFFVEFPCCPYIREGSLLVLRLAPAVQRSAFRWFSDSKLTTGMNQDPGEYRGPLQPRGPHRGVGPL